MGFLAVIIVVFYLVLIMDRIFRHARAHAHTHAHTYVCRHTVNVFFLTVADDASRFGVLSLHWTDTCLDGCNSELE